MKLKKISAVLLAFAMVLCMCNVVAFAQGGPAGNVPKGYIDADWNNKGDSGIRGDAYNVVGTESFEIKFYNGETLVGTSALVDKDKVLLNGQSRTISWHIAVNTAADNDAWWDTEWVNGNLTVNTIPDNGELYVDGTLVDTFEIVLESTDCAYPVVAAATDSDGVIRKFITADGYTNTKDMPEYAAALNEAFKDGGNFVMLRDVELSEEVTVPADTTVTLDLNGHNITVGYQEGSTTKHIYALRNLGVLTISDNKGTGSISARGIYNGAEGSDNSCVDLTVDGAKIIGCDYNGGACIWSYGGNVYVTDAILIGYTGCISSEGFVKINSGTFTCYSGIEEDGTQVASPTYNIRAYNGLHIYDGTFTSRHGVISLGGGVGVIEDGSYTIEFAAKTTSNVVYLYDDAELTINGGEFISDNSADIADSGAAVLVSGDSAKLTVNDGKFVGMNGMVSGNVNTVINGGSFDTVWDYNHYGKIEPYIAVGATVTVGDKIVTKNADGTVTTKDVIKGLSGEGTEASPYLINNLDELKWFRDDVNAGNTYSKQYVKLNASIDLVTEKNWTPIGNSTNKFLGHFDGGNNTISNLKIDNTASYVGLFGYTSNGSLKNLTIHNVDIDGRLGVGALAGCPFTSDISNIKLTGKVTIDAQYYVGGVLGRNAYGDIIDVTVDVDSESYVYANSVDTDGTTYRTYVGGVVGFIGEGNSLIKNVTSNIKVIGSTQDVGGITGIAHYGNTFENVTCTGSVTLKNATNLENALEVGGIAGVWHNKSGYTVTFTNCIFEGEISSTYTAEDGETVTLTAADFANGGLIGSSYNEPTEDSGEMVIDYAAYIGTTLYKTLAEAFAAVKDGETINIMRDVALDKAISFAKDIIFTIDGNGHTVKMADGSTETNSAFNFGQGSDATAATRVYNIKNIVFDGWNTDHVVRLQGVSGTVDNCTFINCNQPDGLGLLTLTFCKVDVVNCTFKNNTCVKAIDVNSWGDNSMLPVTIEECVFEYNTCNSPAVILKSQENPLNITKCEFLKNNVNSTSNAAVIYIGFRENCVVEGCLFQDNTVKSTGDIDTARIGSAIFTGCAPVTVKGNAFINNTASLADASKTYAQVGTYVGYTDIDLNGNYWGGSKPVEGVDYTVSGSGKAILIDTYYESYSIDEKGNVVLSDEILPASRKVAEVDGVMYETLAGAFAAVKDGETINLLPGTISEGTIKMPATLKNVTLKGASGKTSVLKDMKLMAADGNSLAYEGITIDGVVFDNSNILVTGWRTNGVSLKDWAITNCEFKNIVASNNEAAVHINVDANAGEAVNNFTFTNNVIDGISGGSQSGVYMAATGNVVIKNNVINNVTFRPLLIQMADCDNIVDDIDISGNTFSGSALGRLQIYGSEADNGDGTWTPTGTDKLSFAINNNIFKDITNAQQICTWGINPNGGTVDISKNYYDVPLTETRIYWNNVTYNTEEALFELGVYPIYTNLNEDGTIDTTSAYTPVLVSGKVAYRAYITDTDTREAVQVDLKNIYATKSVVIKLFDANGNLLTTSTYKNGAFVGDNMTCNIVLWGEPSGSWDTVINAEKFTVANAPAKIELWIDGILTDTFENAMGDKLGEYKALDCVYKAAEVDGEYYATLQDAINAADGKTVTLLDNVTVDSMIVLRDGKNITIEGEGKTITFNNTEYGFGVVESTLTLGKGLNIVANGQTCPLYVQNGTAFTSANITTTEENRYSPIMINGGFYANVTINGGTITAQNSEIAAIYWPGEGTLTVNDGKIIGSTAIYLKSGNLTINDGEFVANGEKKTYEYLPSAYVSTGDAIVVENVAFDGYEAVGTVSITGGTFTSENAAAIASYATEDAAPVTGFIAGGTFSSDVTALCADGYEATKNEDGTYGIVEAEKSPLGERVGFIRDILKEDGRYEVLLFSGIDNLNYSSVGFEVTVGEVTKIQSTKTVYVGYTAAGHRYTGKDFGDECNYIFAQSVLLNSSLGDASLTYRSFAVKFDGTIIYSDWKTIDDVYREK